MTPHQKQVERIASIWRTPVMSRFARLEYSEALKPYPPDAVAAAVNTVRDTWTKDIVPPPGEFVAKARGIATTRGDERRGEETRRRIADVDVVKFEDWYPRAARGDYGQTLQVVAYKAGKDHPVVVVRRELVANTKTPPVMPKDAA